MRIVLNALTVSLCLTSFAQAESVNGWPVGREGRLVGPVGCQFRCPAGLVQINRVDFYFRNGTNIGPRGWQETRVDGGVLICLGDQRTVGRTSIPQIPFGIIDVTQCRVHYTKIIDPIGQPGRPSRCNDGQLQICLNYGGGQACYDKWCD